MSRVFIVHGWSGSPKKDFLPWANNEFTKLGYKVFMPEMPDTDHPKIVPWVGKLSETVGIPLSGDILIGHSIGCQAVERYLETLPDTTKFQKIILVAPWVILTPETFTEMGEDKSVIEEWLQKPIDYQKIKKMADNWIAVFSDDDPFVKYDDNYKIYKENLGAKVILRHKEGHFSAEQGLNQIPFLLDLVK